jgi:hypothetical protein
VWKDSVSGASSAPARNRPLAFGRMTLMQLCKLLDSGLVSKEEFDQIKNAILKTAIEFDDARPSSARK